MKERKIILFYNSMWDQPLEYPVDQIPESYLLTGDRSLLEDAAAVVFHIPSLPRDFILGRRPAKKAGQIWIAWHMESEAHYIFLGSPLFMSRFDLTMSYRTDSDIFTPYFDYRVKELLRRKPLDKREDSMVNVFISSGYDRSGRVEYLRRLMDILDVHSYGSLFKNRYASSDSGHSFKMDTFARYKFTLAFENAVERDYVTEKFYEPLISGSVPVYLGAPNIEDFAPGDKCFINVPDFDGPESLARYLLDLSRDENEYGSYLEWKDKPYRENFTRLLEQTREHPFVRLCKKVGELLGERFE